MHLPLCSLKYKYEPWQQTSDAGKRKDSRALPGQHWEPMVTQSREQGGRSLQHSHSESHPPAPLPEKGVCWSALLLWGALNPHGIGGVQVAVVGAHYVMGFLVYALTSALGILAWLPGW